MAISKVTAPIALSLQWDTNGVLTGASVTYIATFTDSVTGTVATVTKGPIALDVNNQTVKNDAAQIYAVLPGSSL